MSEDVLDIASTMKKIYESVYNFSGESSDLTEMKMHKLLYFAQKKHFLNFGEWLFYEDFEGWIHGPVNKKVRAAFPNLKPLQADVSDEALYTIREVIYDYGKYTAGVLRNLSHDDIAYKISRFGLRDDQAGEVIITKESIISDLTSQKDNINSNADCEVFF